jgi:hypothetical protein
MRATNAADMVLLMGTVVLYAFVVVGKFDEEVAPTMYALLEVSTTTLYA